MACFSDTKINFQDMSSTARDVQALFILFRTKRRQILGELFETQERFSFYCSWRSQSDNWLHF